MNKCMLFVMSLLLCTMTFVSCNREVLQVDDENIDYPTVSKNKVLIWANLGEMSRATDTKFDYLDEIGVFAVLAGESDNKGFISDKGNYADNVRYIYDGTKFSSNQGIVLHNTTDKYFYHAVYPYTAVAASSFLFSVQSDQRGEGYTNSDLCTAHSSPTSSNLVHLDFDHRLSKIIVNLEGTNWPSGDLNLTIKKPCVEVLVDLNSLSFESTVASKKKDVVCSENGLNSFKVVLPPQKINREDFAVLTIGDKNYSVSLENDLDLKSGIQREITLKFTDNGEIVEFTGDINPWEEEDNRIENVVPADIREKLDDYITIYDGVNPPNIEGVFFLDPCVTVYCEDEGNGGFEPGKLVNSLYIRFSNQNTVNNTLDYDDISAPLTSVSSGKGAFISGSGSNFTAYFNTEGTTDGIYTKTALVVSGTKVVRGIENLQYAFVMVEKGEDPENELMKEGVFRVFEDEDGFSVQTTWPVQSAPSRSGLSLFEFNSFVK